MRIVTRTRGKDKYFERTNTTTWLERRFVVTKGYTDNYNCSKSNSTDAQREESNILGLERVEKYSRETGDKIKRA